MNKNPSMNNDARQLQRQQSDIYFDHGTDLSSKLVVRDHELMFAFNNENENSSNVDDNNMNNNGAANGGNGNGSNVGWLGFVVSKIKIGAFSQGISSKINENVRQYDLLKQSGLRFDRAIGISSICFGLNQNCTKVLGYILRQHSIDCIEFTDRDYKLLWTYSLRNIMAPNEKTIIISLLGQGLSILTGYIDDIYGQALTVRLFKINVNKSDNNRGNNQEIVGLPPQRPVQPLRPYGVCPVQLPPHIRLQDLHKLRYQSFWSYYNDPKANKNMDSFASHNQDDMNNNNDNKNDKEEMDADSDGPGFGPIGFLKRQTSMAEFVEQRKDERNDIIKCQHYLVAPFGMVWNTDNSSQFIALFPLIHTNKSDDSLLDLNNDKCDEIWERLYGDYNRLYPGMQLNNTCGPDGDHFRNDLVTIFEPSLSRNNDNKIPFYGGGCMLLPYRFEDDWKEKHDENNDNMPQFNLDRSSQEEDDEKKIIQEDDEETDDGTGSTRNRNRNRNKRKNKTGDELYAKTAACRHEMRQLQGGGYGYFMNDKYQIMRLKYSLSSAMARIHPDMNHYQQQQKELEGVKTKKLIRLAFSEYRNGNEGQPRANRLSDKLIQEKDINILSTQICKISESILDLELFDTFKVTDVPELVT